MVLIIKQEIVAHCKVCHGEKLLEQCCHFGFLSEGREEELQFLHGVILSRSWRSSRALPPSCWTNPLLIAALCAVICLQQRQQEDVMSSHLGFWLAGPCWELEPLRGKDAQGFHEVLDWQPVRPVQQRPGGGGADDLWRKWRGFGRDDGFKWFAYLTLCLQCSRGRVWAAGGEGKGEGALSVHWTFLSGFSVY